MMRNAWHISGGEGWAANSANRRVLVTAADGSQSVQEIRDDLGLKADDKAGMIARLRAQGTNVSSISITDGAGDKVKGFPAQPFAAGMKSNGGQASASTRKTANAAYKSSISIGQTDFDDAKVENFSGKRVQTSQSSLSGSVIKDPKPTRDGGLPPKFTLAQAAMLKSGRQISDIINDLREQLKARGARGIVGLSRKFKTMDKNGDGSLNLAEFTKGMNECDLSLSDIDVHSLFSLFDKNGSGEIDFDEFLAGVKVINSITEC
jgi:hypothetical protein